jgi:hypothetical protein
MTARSKLLLALGLPLGAVVVVAALFVFQPWKLFVDDVVEEAFPAPSVPAAAPADPGTGTPTPGADPPPTIPAPVLVSSGDFVGLDHPTSGSAGLYELSSGERLLRLEDFRTDNGPDLFVYLSAAPIDGSEPFDDDVIDLGMLKGNVGNQNYEIPDGIDLGRYSTVVVWCKRFTSAFGAASLT